jgi:hypothetical protein
MNNQGTQRDHKAALLTGVFYDRETTEKAYRDLIDRGYTEQEINVMMSEETRDKYYKDGDSEVGTKALEGTGVGAMVGGTLGAIIGGIAAVGSNLVIPGVGLVIAGPIAAALAGAGAGSLAGGLTGALIGWGIPEERVVHYEKGIREGGTVLGVTPKSEEDATFLENEWRNKYNAEHVYR